MNNEIRSEYQPDSITQPGFYIQERLAESGMTQTEGRPDRPHQEDRQRNYYRQGS